MNCRLTTVAILCTGLLACRPATADDWAFKNSLNLGFRSIDFSQDFQQSALTVGAFTFAGPAKRTADYKVDFKSLEYVFTANWKRYFATFNYETSIDTQSGTFDGSYTPIGGGSGSSHGHGIFDYHRADYSITLGWNVVDNLSVFAGYKSGATDSSRLGQGYDPVTTLTNSAMINTKYQEDGPFAGISYSWVLGHGVLTASGAWAYMNGDFSTQGSELIINSKPPASDFALTQQALNYNGHTNGFSVNLSWNVQASDNVGYYYGAKYQEYDFDASTDVTWKLYDRNVVPTTIYNARGTGSVTNKETITAFYAGVNYTF